MGIFKRKSKTTFEDLPKDVQRLILNFNAEWNTSRMVESWAIMAWDKEKDLYHRAGGDQLYMLHLMAQLIEGKIQFHCNTYQQVDWIRKTYTNYAPKYGLSYGRLAEVTQFPTYILKLMDKWLMELVMVQKYHPDWEPLRVVNISPNSISDIGLWPSLMNELREHNLLYILWASNWHGKSNYMQILVLLHQFLSIIAPKFQNPDKVYQILDEIIGFDLPTVKEGFLEYLKNCY